LNLAETCSDENVVQLITDYKLEPNNKSDVEIIEELFDTIKKNTDISDLYTGDGYYGESVIDKARY